MHAKLAFVCICLLLLCCVCECKPKTANTPPMGWRTWNCWESDISQAKIQNAIDAMSAPFPIWNGSSLSLIQLGYTHVGIDENWEKCGAGVNGSFHDAKGRPIFNTDLFPDMSGLVKYAHSKQAYLDWYLNNCAPCDEHQENIPANYVGDIQVWNETGFDGTKVDGCGVAISIQAYADQLEAMGKPYLLEQCNDPFPRPTPNSTWCPFHTFRTSTDISPMWESVVYNIQTMLPFLEGDNPISQQNCWPQPDMLEVGNTNPPGGAVARAPVLTVNESRAHFGLWAVTSAPLILGHDVTNASMTAAVWDIVSNTEAISVNQVWAGHSGRLVQTSNTSFSAIVYHGASNDIRDGPLQLPSWQVWAKRLVADGSKQAILVVNYHPTDEADIDLSLGQLGFPATVKSVSLRDIWVHHTSEGALDRFATSCLPHTSVFVILEAI